MLALLAAALLATTPAPPPSGDWVVDLSPPSGPAYLKGMSLTLAPDGVVTGSFYDSTIEAGRWKTAQGRTCVSFRTSDGKGPYHTAACWRGDDVSGQTWAEQRNFVFIWSARAATAADRQAPWW